MTHTLRQALLWKQWSVLTSDGRKRDDEGRVERPIYDERRVEIEE